MSLEASLFQYLTAQAPIIALIKKRMYPESAPKGACYPYLTYSTVFGKAEKHLGAASALSLTTIQLDCCGETKKQAVELGEALREELDGMRGATIGTTTTTVVESISIQSTRDTIERPDSGQEQVKYIRQIDVDVWHVTTVPTF